MKEKTINVHVKKIVWNRLNILAAQQLSLVFICLPFYVLNVITIVTGDIIDIVKLSVAQ